MVFEELRTAGAGGRGRRSERHGDDRRQFGVRLRGRQGAARHRDGAAARHAARSSSAPCSPAPTSRPPSARASYFAPYPPSSPSVALLQDGKLVFMMERRDIETRDAHGDRRRS